MGFHTFTKPVDYVLPKATSRSNFVFDSDLVSGNVRLLLDYQGGPVLATFGAPDDTMILDLPMDRGLQTTGSRATWNSGNPWKVLGNKVACPGAANGYMAHHLAAATANIDVSVDVSADNEAGLAFRNGSNSTSGPGGTGGSGKITVTIVPTTSNLAHLAAVKGHVVGQEDFNTYRTFPFTGASTITAGTTYNLRVNVVGNLYTIYLNGVLEGSFSTAANSASTDHGLLVSTDDAARIDNYSIVRTTLPVATTYTVRNYEGDILTSGSITSDVVDIPDSILKQRNNLGPYGWYRVYLTGPDHGDGQWGTAYGDCTFMRIPTSSLPANAAATTPRVSGGDGDEIARGVMGLGTVRYSIQSSATAAATTIATVLPRMAAEKTWQVDTASAARPRNLLIAFPNGTAGNESNVTAIVAGLKDYVKVWECRNEPNYFMGDGTYWAAHEFADFHAAVKAGDPNAIVIGPGSVSFRDGPGAADILYFQAFLDGGGANNCEAFSFHPYNCYQGDVSTMRYTLGHVATKMASVGKSSYDLWMTEQGYGWAYAGIVWPHYATRWTSLMFFGQSVITGDKMRPETTAYWYDLPIGFDDFPMMWLLDSGPGPTMGPVRTMSAEIFGKTFTNELDFGNYAKNIYLGGVWTNSSTGAKVLGLQASSYGANPIRVKVTGATTFTLVDPWGNTSTLTASGGDISFPVCELPQWLRIPSGSTAVLEPTDWAWGANACLTGTPATSCPTYTNLPHINNDVHENPYSMGFTAESFCFTAPATSGPLDMTFPQTVDVTFASQTITRVAIFCNAPWQPLLGTLVDFDLQTFNGSTWTTRKTWTGDITKSFVFTSGEARCRMETYWHDQYIFDYQFPTPLTIQGVRCLIRNASWTAFDTQTTSDSFGGNGQNGYQYKITIREIQAFNAAGGPPPTVTGSLAQTLAAFTSTSTGSNAPPSPPSRIRNPAMSGVT